MVSQIKTIDIFQVLPVTFFHFKTIFLIVGSADTLLRTHFPDGMSESLIAYLLHGVLKGLEYLHRRGYVHRWLEVRTHGFKNEASRCLTVFSRLLSGEWRPVISCCQGRGASTSRDSTAFTAWCGTGRGWRPCSTCRTTARRCCRGSALNCCGRSGGEKCPQMSKTTNYFLKIFPVYFSIEPDSVPLVVFVGVGSVGPARLWSEVRHLQSGNCSLWAGQRASAFPGHAAHSGNFVKTI